MSVEQEARYGVLESNTATDPISLAVERLAFRGFCTIDSGLSTAELEVLRADFDQGKARYDSLYGEDLDLEALGEHQTLRVLPHVSPAFWVLLKNPALRALLDALFGKSVALNQMNGLINPPVGAQYNQARWHRDLPYQHFTSSRPLAINALFCLDEFTSENGATEVAVGSHMHAPFPSEPVLDDIRQTLTAPAGTFLVLDAMTFHRGGQNRTHQPRRAVNHVFTIPPIRRQLAFGDLLASGQVTDPEILPLLTAGGAEERSVRDWLEGR